MRRLESKDLVIATHNAGKLAEFRELLAPYGVNVISAGDLGLEEPEETESTFAGNARIKAHFAARESGLPALSDDSGICVEALEGAPGVHTEPRRASFICTLCLAWPDGHDEIFEGRVDGRLVWPMRGDRGFGFDPIFLPDGESQTFGEMDPARKKAISHRSDAFRKLIRGCLA